MAVIPLDVAARCPDGDIPLCRLEDGPRPPRRRPPWYLEVLIVVWLGWAYDQISNFAPLRENVAIGHGLDIIGLERVLRLDLEVPLDRWLSAHYSIGLWVSTYYDNAHFVVTFAVIGWLFWRHPEPYRSLRTSLVVVNLIGFVGFWLYPTAPPRLLPGYHIADVVAVTGAFGSSHSGDLADHANELAAMPSLHIAWAAWSALAVWRVLRPRRFALVVFAYPLATTLAVLATGNHYFLDVVAGIATLALADVGARLLGRLGCRLPLPGRLKRRRAKLRLRAVNRAQPNPPLSRPAPP